MNCQYIKRSGKPANWLHALFCPDCRASQRIDDLLAFGIVQLRSSTDSHAAMNRTLTTLQLSPLPDDYLNRIRNRRLQRKRRIAMASATAGVLGWCGYMNWMPSESNVPAVKGPTPAFVALKSAVDSKDYSNFSKLNRPIEALQGPLTQEPHPETETVDRFLKENSFTLDLVHRNLTQPYREAIPLTRQEQYQPSPIYPFTMLLRADAASKAAHGDRSGALEAALKVITFGANVEGGGSMLTRLLGERCQQDGRLLLWHMLPKLSAEKSLQAAHRVEAAGKLHVPLVETARWERLDGLAMRHNLMSGPFWRWQLFGFTSAFGINSEPGYRVTLRLHGFSNQRIMSEYLAEMDAVEADWSSPYSALHTIPLAEPQDPVNQLLMPFYQGAKFMDTENQAQNALLMTALAIHAYHLEHGTDPATLQALCPKYLEQIPVDPFEPRSPLQYVAKKPEQCSYNSKSVDGRAMVEIGVTIGHASYIGHASPFERELTFPSYLLYSVGPDGTDEHGAFIYGNSTAPTVSTSLRQRLRVATDSRGDIVAGINF